MRISSQTNAEIRRSHVSCNPRVDFQCREDTVTHGSTESLPYRNWDPTSREKSRTGGNTGSVIQVSLYLEI